MNYTKRLASAISALIWLVAQPAVAQEVQVAAPSAKPSEGPLPTPYLKRYVPEHLMWELGLFGGAMFPSKYHQLFDDEMPRADRQKFNTAGELGVRFAFYPLSFVGVEAEGAVMPTSLEDGTHGGLWAVRAHGILQLPLSSLVPFLLVGGGTLGGTSNAMGNDADPTLQFGAGLKVALDEHLLLRVEGRDSLHRASDFTDASTAHSPEVLIGLSFVPKRGKPDRDRDGVLDYRDKCPTTVGDQQGCPAPDQDADGIADTTDECVDAAGQAPSGCPDKDKDGLLDRDDPCPEAAGSLPGGCPEKVCPVCDLDGDGLVNEADQCPSEAAKTPTGCVIHDQDSDGVIDEQDKCPAEAENKDGVDDADGCPELIPVKT